MANIRLVTCYPIVASDVAQKLVAAGHSVCYFEAKFCTICKVLYRRSTDSSRLFELNQVLAPITVSAFAPADLPPDIDLEIYLGESHQLWDWPVNLYTDSAPFARAFRSLFQRHGVCIKTVELAAQAENRIQFGRIPPYYLELFSALLGQFGITPALVQHFRIDGRETSIFVRNPAHANMRYREFFPLKILTDDPKACEPLLKALQTQGFLPCLIEQKVPDLAPQIFSIIAGPLNKRCADEEKWAISIVNEFLRRKCVDDSLFPLRLVDMRTENDDGPCDDPLYDEESVDPSSIYLSLPLDKLAKRSLVPYAEGMPGSFRITIQTDDKIRIRPLAKALAAKGFQETAIYEWKDTPMCPGAMLGLPKETQGAVSAALREILCSSLQSTIFSDPDAFPIVPARQYDQAVSITIPFNDLDAGTVPKTFAKMFSEIWVLIDGALPPKKRH